MQIYHTCFCLKKYSIYWVICNLLYQHIEIAWSWKSFSCVEKLSHSWIIYFNFKFSPPPLGCSLRLSQTSVIFCMHVNLTVTSTLSLLYPSIFFLYACWLDCHCQLTPHHSSSTTTTITMSTTTAIYTTITTTTTTGQKNGPKWCMMCHLVY